MIFSVTNSLTIRSYTILYIYSINVNFYQVKILIFCNVQITKSTVVGKNEMYNKYL